MLQEGDTIPDVRMQTEAGSAVALRDMLDGALVLYFYPKDDTSGCTVEAIDFSHAGEAFNAVGTKVIGISKNSPKDHAKFIAKHDLKVQLVTDADGSVCEAFGTWIEKSMYGRKYMGIDRATFLIDGQGRIVRAWRKVKVPGHVDAVLEAARALHAASGATVA